MRFYSAIVGLLLTLSAVAEPLDEIPTYGGFNLQEIWAKPRGEWQNLLVKVHPGFNFYLGARVHERVGVEVGYGWTNHKSKSIQVPNGSSYWQVRNTTGQSIILRGRARLRMGYVDLKYFIPLSEDDCIKEQVKPELFLSIGIGSVTPRLRFSSPDQSGTTDVFNNNFLPVAARTSTIARAGIGVQGMFTEHLGVRVFWQYLNLAKLSARGGVAARFHEAAKLFNNGHSLGVGLIVRF